MLITIIVIISLISFLTSIVLCFILYFKLKSVYINLYRLSKGLDTLWENQQKILELTNIKNFVQLVNEEEPSVRKNIYEERTRVNEFKKTKESVRSPNSNPNDKGS